MAVISPNSLGLLFHVVYTIQLLQIDDGNDFLIIYNGGSEKGEMIEKLTGKLNKNISILGNQIFVVLNINETITRQRSFSVKILESMFFFSIYYVNHMKI